MNARTILSMIMLFLTRNILEAQPAYPSAPPAPENITAIEWFIDKDPGIGNGTPLTFTNAPDIANLTAPIPLTSLPRGIHRLFIRSKDLSGTWSLTAATTFENFHPDYAAAPPALSPISQLEVFFDNDPGFGKGSIQTVPAGTDVSNLTLTLGIDSLSKGPHQLFVRVPGNTPSLSAIAGFSNDVPLPLTWIYIKGEIIDGQSHIDWATAQESNTKNFEVQHSLDGQTFSTIGTIPAAGNSTTITPYTWTDAKPATGTNYYRIKEVDLDSRSSNSKVVMLRYNFTFTKTIAMPNPVKKTLTLILAHPAERSVLIVYNTAGQPVLTVLPEERTQQQTLDLGPLPAGVYFVRIQYRTDTEIVRIIKE